MKKEVKLVLCMYRQILRDYSGSAAFTTKVIDLTVEQIGQLIAHRGIRVVYLDFPTVGKVIDSSLSSGTLQFCEIKKVLGSTAKSVYPRIFKPLFEALYDSEGNLRADPDPNDMLFLRQLLLMFKKVVRKCETSVEEQAKSEFHTLDTWIGHHFPGESLIWDDPSPGRVPFPTLLHNVGEVQDPVKLQAQRLLRKLRLHQNESLAGRSPERVAQVMSRVFRLITGRFPALTLSDLIPSHGTGAVADMAWGDKYSFPEWSDKLDKFFPVEEFAMLNYGGYQDFFARRKRGQFQDRETPVKILAVPKTLKGPRIIGSESVSRMFCQQSLKTWMREHLGHVAFGSIDIEDQTLSQKRAVQGSISGRLATIDLSSASDRLSCALVEEVLSNHYELLRGLSACRALEYTVPHGTFPMQKFAHQGSAVTFPVQSLCYYAICVVAWHLDHGIDYPTPKTLRRASRFITVYGDDIIVPAHCYGTTTSLLTIWGLKVNEDKSHQHGFFRESCGVDAYKGFDITPAYIRDVLFDMRKPETVVRFVEVGNNLHEAGFWKASTVFFSEFGVGKIPITRSEQVALRHYTFSAGRSNVGLRLREASRFPVNFDEEKQNLQVPEVYSFQPHTKGVKTRRGGYESILQFHLENSNSPTQCIYFRWQTPAMEEEMLEWVAGFYEERPKVGLSWKWIQADL